MPSFEVGPLKQKLSSLHTEPQVERAVLRKEQREGRLEKRTPEAKIDVYLKRLEAVFQHPDYQKRQRNISLFKPILHKEFVISKEDFPDSYIELQKKIAREQGHGEVEVTPELRGKMLEEIQRDQVARLDEWVDYLTSEDAGYPTWFKYLAFRSITKLSQFDKEKGHFKTRSKDTTSTYPDIYREALAIVADKLENLAKVDPKKLKEFDKRRREAEERGEEFHLTEEEKKWPFRTYEEFLKYSQEKFPNLYAEAIQSTLESSLEGREITRGEWVRYEQGNTDDTSRLYSSLQGQGTGWCTAGKSTAENQLQNGDFYVYYTYKEDSDALPTKPRIAIRMQGSEIAEVRGVLPNQNIEPILDDITAEKLESFGSKADKFKKKSADMKRMTELTQKKEAGEEFSSDDLQFLYELNSPIEGFGYHKDPRIEELKKERSWKKDMYKIYFPTEGPSDDDNKIAKAFLEGGKIGFLSANFDKFQNLNQEIALAIMGDASVPPSIRESVLDNLKSFSNLDFNILARKTIEIHAGMMVMVDSEKFKNLNIIETGYFFLEHEKGKEWAEKVRASESLMPGSLARAILELPHGHRYVAANLSSFNGLDKDIATLLIESLNGAAVVNNSELFKDLKLDQDLALILIRKQNGKALIDNIDKFENLDTSKIVLTYLEGNQQVNTWHIFQNLTRFKGALTQEVFDRLLEVGMLESNDSYELRKLQRKFPDLEFSEEQITQLNRKWKDKTVSRLLEVEGGIKLINKKSQEIENLEEILSNFFAGTDLKTLAENISRSVDNAYTHSVFEGKLHKAIALKMIELGYENDIVQSVDYFAHDGHQEILDALLKKGKLRSILHFTSLRRFHDIDFSALYMRAVEADIDDGLKNNNVPPYFGDFKNLDSRVAQFFLTRREYSRVGDNLGKFQGLSDFIANKLIDNGFGTQISQHLSSFTNLQPETLGRLEAFKSEIE